MRFFKRTAIIILIFASFGGLGAWAFVYFGVYTVSALEQHTPPVYRLLQYAMERSVAMRSVDIKPPETIRQLDWQLAGLELYADHCQQCHGAPGIAPDAFSLGMVPAPTAIASIARKRDMREIYWVIRHGIKMSGMPAWEYRLSDTQIWQVVAFIKQIPELTVADYLAMKERAVMREQRYATIDAIEDPKDENRVHRGQVALQQYNCVSCHEIPGLAAGRNQVGPPLAGITQRSFTAGVLETTDENLVRWIRFPQDISPRTAMPNLGVTEYDARAMVAYLRKVDSTD